MRSEIRIADGRTEFLDLARKAASQSDAKAAHITHEGMLADAVELVYERL